MKGRIFILNNHKQLEKHAILISSRSIVVSVIIVISLKKLQMIYIFTKKKSCNLIIWTNNKKELKKLMSYRMRGLILNHIIHLLFYSMIHWKMENIFIVIMIEPWIWDLRVRMETLRLNSKLKHQKSTEIN